MVWLVTLNGYCSLCGSFVKISLYWQVLVWFMIDVTLVYCGIVVVFVRCWFVALLLYCLFRFEVSCCLGCFS